MHYNAQNWYVICPNFCNQGTLHKVSEADSFQNQNKLWVKQNSKKWKKCTFLRNKIANCKPTKEIWIWKLNTCSYFANNLEQVFQNCVQLDIFNKRSYSATIFADRIVSQPNHKFLFEFEFDFPTLFLCDQNDKFD